MYSCPCSTTSFTNVSLALSAPLPNCDGRRASAILVQRGGCVWLVAGGWWLVAGDKLKLETRDDVIIATELLSLLYQKQKGKWAESNT
jgi:hypothetical protein